jgi:integrase
METHFAFTDTKIAKLNKRDLPDGKGEQFFYDAKTPGLAVRLRSSGAKSYIYFLNRKQRITIGDAAKLKVEQARDAASIHAGDMAKHGFAKTAETAKEEAKAAEAKVTLRALVNDEVEASDGIPRKPGPYETSLLRRGVVNAQVAISALRRGLAKHLATNIKALDRRDYTACFDAIADTGKLGAAQDCRKHTHTFLVWAEKQGYIDHNPLAGYREEKKTRAQMVGKRRKGRRLTDDEVKKVWAASGKLGAFGLLARMALLGGARRSEPAMMQWAKHVMADRVVFEDAEIKSGAHTESHEIPRTLLIDSVLDDAKRFQLATTDYVFSSNKTGREISGFTKLVARLVREAGVAKFTMHDLRRTLRSMMTDCGVIDNDLQRLCIGQKPEKNLDAIYNLSEAWAVRKLIFDIVHDHIAKLVGGPRGENVVRLYKDPMKHELLKRLAEVA